jgi:hypothetical protein
MPRMNKLQKLVYETIQLNPGVENDDAALVAAVWRRQGWDDGVTLEDNIRRVARAESITRRRRELHVMGLIEYSEAADKDRTQAFVNERDRHGKAVRWR